MALRCLPLPPRAAPRALPPSWTVSPALQLAWGHLQNLQMRAQPLQQP
jgi:hypothetical protein